MKNIIIKFKRWLLSIGPGSPGQLTRHITKNYLRHQIRDPFFKNEVFFKHQFNMHFMGIIPDNAGVIVKSFNSVGPKFNDMPESFFDCLIEKTNGELFPFVFIYVILYNRDTLIPLLHHKQDAFSVIESEYVKLVPADKDPLTKYNYIITDVFDYITIQLLKDN